MREKVLELAQDQYGTEPEYLFAKYPGFAVLRHPNKKWYGVVMDLSRQKLGLPGEGMVDALNVKCDPCMSGSLRLQPGILPAYHMNKERWITVLLDGTVDLEQIGILLDISYDVVGSKPKKIPQSKKQEKPLISYEISGFNPSGETRTRGILVPNQAPYQLGHTREKKVLMVVLAK